MKVNRNTLYKMINEVLREDDDEETYGMEKLSKFLQGYQEEYINQAIEFMEMGLFDISTIERRDAARDIWSKGHPKLAIEFYLAGLGVNAQVSDVPGVGDRISYMVKVSGDVEKAKKLLEPLEIDLEIGDDILYVGFYAEEMVNFRDDMQKMFNSRPPQSSELALTLQSISAIHLVNGMSELPRVTWVYSSELMHHIEVLMNKERGFLISIYLYGDPGIYIKEQIEDSHGFHEKIVRNSKGDEVFDKNEMVSKIMDLTGIDLAEFNKEPLSEKIDRHYLFKMINEVLRENDDDIDIDKKIQSFIDSKNIENLNTGLHLLGQAEMFDWIQPEEAKALKMRMFDSVVDNKLAVGDIGTAEGFINNDDFSSSFSKEELDGLKRKLFGNLLKTNLRDVVKDVVDDKTIPINDETYGRDLILSVGGITDQDLIDDIIVKFSELSGDPKFAVGRYDGDEFRIYIGELAYKYAYFGENAKEVFGFEPNSDPWVDVFRDNIEMGTIDGATAKSAFKKTPSPMHHGRLMKYDILTEFNFDSGWRLLISFEGGLGGDLQIRYIEKKNGYLIKEDSVLLLTRQPVSKQQMLDIVKEKSGIDLTSVEKINESVRKMKENFGESPEGEEGQSDFDKLVGLASSNDEGNVRQALSLYDMGIAEMSEEDEKTLRDVLTGQIIKHSSDIFDDLSVLYPDLAAEVEKMNAEKNIPSLVLEWMKGKAQEYVEWYYGQKYPRLKDGQAHKMAKEAVSDRSSVWTKKKLLDYNYDWLFNKTMLEILEEQEWGNGGKGEIWVGMVPMRIVLEEFRLIDPWGLASEFEIRYLDKTIYPEYDRITKDLNLLSPYVDKWKASEIIKLISKA